MTFQLIQQVCKLPAKILRRLRCTRRKACLFLGTTQNRPFQCGFEDSTIQETIDELMPTRWTARRRARQESTWCYKVKGLWIWQLIPTLKQSLSSCRSECRRVALLALRADSPQSRRLYGANTSPKKFSHSNLRALLLPRLSLRIYIQLPTNSSLTRSVLFMIL